MKKTLLLAALTLIAGCGGNSSQPASTSATPGSASTSIQATGDLVPTGDSKKIVAELNGTPITEAELYNTIANRLARLQLQLYETEKMGINQIIEERLLKVEAEKRGMSVKALLKLEVQDKVGDISEKELSDFYNQNKNRFPDKTLDQVKDSIKKQLIARKASVYQKNYFDRLLADAKVKILIEAPRTSVSEDDDPSQGGKNAKVVIVEFTDYQCPFCKRARPVVKQVLSDYGDKVRYVLRDFPLDIHGQAQKAAEGAHCAGEQNKYWPYSDLLWDNNTALDVSDLKKYAAQLGLDAQKFDQCLDSGKFAEEVQKDMKDGANSGVSGTPTFIINGQLITGAGSIEQFKAVIDGELKK